MAASPSTLSFHSQARQEYSERWFVPESRVGTDVTAAAAAYYLLEHSGMYYRYSGNDSDVRKLMNLAAAQKHELIRCAQDALRMHECACPHAHASTRIIRARQPVSERDSRPTPAGCEPDVPTHLEDPLGPRHARMGASLS